MAYYRDDVGINDNYTGTYSYDSVYLLAGDDVARMSYDNDYVEGGDGSDSIWGGFNDDTLLGQAGDDKLYGESGDDSLAGGAGKDILSGQAGDDVLNVGTLAEMTGDAVYGGTGLDTLVADFTGMTVALNFLARDPLLTYSVAGQFSVIGVERYKLVGTALNDRIEGYKLDDRLDGGDGQDQLFGNLGDDTIYGGNGADRIYGGLGADSLYGDGYYSGAGDDQIWGGGGGDSIDGGAGADKLYGEAGFDSLYGGEGDDTLDGGADGDTLRGDQGDDSLTGGLGNDWLYGGAGADTVLGGAGNDTVMSGSSWYYNNDLGTEIDVVWGHDGDDSVGIGVGDTGYGGTGIDTIHLSFSNSDVGVTYTVTTDLVTLANNTTLQNFEAIDFEGGSGSDRITGAALYDDLQGGGGDDVLSGMDGHDSLGGGDGSDTLDGGVGNDSLDGGEGDDTLTGGAGNDTFRDYSYIGGKDTHRGGLGDDTFYTGRGDDKLYGDEGADTFYIREDELGVDLIDGGVGVDFVDFWSSESVYLDLQNQATNDGAIKNDTFVSIERFDGSYNDDVMLGDALANTLNGALGDDVLNGRGGSDRIDGGAGSDVMTGGLQPDRFVLDYYDNYSRDWPADVITDFTRGFDKLEFDDSEFGLAPGQSAALILGADPVSAAAAPTFLFETDSSRLWYDRDGTAEGYDPVLIVTLERVTTLTAADFVVV